MKQKPKPQPDYPEQSARFLETAKEVGATDGKTFARAFKKIVPKKPKN